MDEAGKSTYEREPEESGTREVQQPSTTSINPAIIQSSGEIKGHPLPDAIGELAYAFRSSPAWLLIHQWTSQLAMEHEETKRDLKQTRNALQEEKIRSAKLRATVSGSRKMENLRGFLQVVGAVLAGTAWVLWPGSPGLTITFFSIGIVMIVVGFWFGNLDQADFKD